MILVTGSFGFVGRNVCARLSRESLSFVGIDRRGPAPCDIIDRDAVRHLFSAQRIDTVIHLAALLPSACRRDPAEATRVNILGSANLLDVAAESGVKRFIFGSSISVCSAQTDPDLYGAGKRYIECYGLNLARAHPLEFAALRIATVIGPGARHTASTWRSEIFEKLGAGESYCIRIPLPADAIVSLVHVEDVARMLVLLATCPRIPDPVYDTPAEEWRIRDLKSLVESIDANLIITPEDPGSLQVPPLADGAPFARDFAWQAPPLRDRLAAAAEETSL